MLKDISEMNKFDPQHYSTLSTTGWSWWPSLWPWHCQSKQHAINWSAIIDKPWALLGRLCIREKKKGKEIIQGYLSNHLSPSKVVFSGAAGSVQITLNFPSPMSMPNPFWNINFIVIWTWIEIYEFSFHWTSSVLLPRNAGKRHKLLSKINKS